MYERYGRENNTDLRKRGRPKAKVPYSKKILISFTEEQYDRLKQLADHYNKNISDFVRYAVKRQEDEFVWNGFKFKNKK